MRRAALAAGVSMAALLCAGMTGALASSSVEIWTNDGRIVSAPAPEPAQKAAPAPAKKVAKKSPIDRSAEPKFGRVEKAPPTGPLHIIVSINKQRVTLYAGGEPYATGPISSGTHEHPTPEGVFSVIQKNRHHVSNLYDAPMPYMQRITWQGSALHQGALPGYPASHGCVRLTDAFAQLLWKTTKLGARIIITRDDVPLLPIEHATLDALLTQSPQAERAPDPTPTSALVRTAAAGNPTIADVTAPAASAAPVIDAPPVVPAGSEAGTVSVPMESATAANAAAPEQPTKLSRTDGAAVAPSALSPMVEIAKPIETPAVAAPLPSIAAPAAIIVEERPRMREQPPIGAPLPTPILVEGAQAGTLSDIPLPPRMPRYLERANNSPVSLLVSLKDRKLYARQGMDALFEMPISVPHPEQPLGTHVYTAMGPKAEGTGLHWTVVSIPSNTRRTAEPVTSQRSRKPQTDRSLKRVEEPPALPSAAAALDRIVIPPAALERIANLVRAGSSLIVTDNALSDETDNSTEFIVMTR